MKMKGLVVMQFRSIRKRKLEQAISYYETNLEREVANFRAYAQECDVESIIAFLPTMIWNIQENQRQLKKLKQKLICGHFLIRNNKAKCLRL